MMPTPKKLRAVGRGRYGRAIDVLDALAAARIDTVTFTVSEEE